ncbi:hypothetical protein A4A49_63441, partial [Nicotiana attenuata]
QRDRSGHIIDNPKEKEDGKNKGKVTEGAVAVKNKFDALQVEELDQTMLRITDGKGEYKVNGKKKEQGDNQAKKVKEKEKEKEKVHITGNSSTNPKSNGIRLAGKEGIPNPIGGGIQKIEELRRAKKEAVEKIQSKEKENAPNPINYGIEEDNMKDSTLEWVHRRFGANKEEIRQLNVTLNHSCHEIPSK